MSVLYDTILAEPDYRRGFEQEMRRMLQDAIQEAKRKLLQRTDDMSDRDYEIELSTLRAELAEVTTDRNDWRIRFEASEDERIRGQRELATVKAAHNDWRDIAIGLRDFGGPPLPKHQRQFGELLARYLEKLRKEGA